MKIAVVYITHVYNKAIEEQLLLLQAAIQNSATLFVAYQEEAVRPSLPEGILPFGFTVRELNLLGVRTWKCSMQDGNSHTIMLDFFKIHSDFDYFWFIEYDVRFSGNWSTFFSFFQNKDEDFISSHILNFEENPEWSHWNDLFLMNLDLNENDRLSSFNPICRLSYRALALLEERCSLGDYGHLEVLLPTLFKYYKLNIKDLGGMGRYTYKVSPNLFYQNYMAENNENICTHRFRPMVKKEEIKIANKIYHPVKE